MKTYSFIVKGCYSLENEYHFCPECETNLTEDKSIQVNGSHSVCVEAGKLVKSDGSRLILRDRTTEARCMACGHRLHLEPVLDDCSDD